jgi:hypothetical protein
VTKKKTKTAKPAEKPPNRRGRKTLLTMEKVDNICSYIRAGNYQKVAAAICGIKERTFYNWIEKASKRKRPSAVQLHLLQSLAEAEAMFEGLHVQRIFNSKDPRVSLEMLARRFPDRWGTVQKTRAVDADGKDVKPAPGVLVVPGIMDETEWAEAAQRYKQLQPTATEETPDDGDAIH